MADEWLEGYKHNHTTVFLQLPRDGDRVMLWEVDNTAIIQWLTELIQEHLSKYLLSLQIQP